MKHLYGVYGVDIILDSETAEKLKSEYPIVELDNIESSNNSMGSRIYSTSWYIPEHYKEHKKFLRAYYCGEWKGAIFFAKDLAANGPVDLRQYYKNMIARMEEGKPDNWDGTFRATSK